MQVETVDLILQKTLGVFETIQNRIQGCVNEIVHVLGAHSGNFRLWRQLWRDDPDYVAPLLIELDVFADRRGRAEETVFRDRKSTRLNSSHQIISYAVFCLKKKKKHCKLTFMIAT